MIIRKKNYHLGLKCTKSSSFVSLELSLPQNWTQPWQRNVKWSNKMAAKGTTYILLIWTQLYEIDRILTKTHQSSTKIQNLDTVRLHLQLGHKMSNITLSIVWFGNWRRIVWMKSLLFVNRLWWHNLNVADPMSVNEISRLRWKSHPVIIVWKSSCDLRKMPNHKNWSVDAKENGNMYVVIPENYGTIETWIATCVDAKVILMTIQRWMETSWTIHNTTERHFSNLNRLWELCELRRDCPHNK